MISFAQTIEMDKVYHLSTCDTCRKILKSLPQNAKLEHQDIRKEPISAEELEEMRRLAGSYEALFSRKSQLYKSLGLKDKTLTEEDYKGYLLQHYTFLSRPVFIIAGEIYIGNSPKNTEAVVSRLS